MATKDPYRYFRIEARELLEKISVARLQLENDPPEHRAAVVTRLCYLFHTLKGAASVLKCPDIASLSLGAEEILAILRDKGEPASLGQLDELSCHCEDIARCVDALQPSGHTAVQ